MPEQHTIRLRGRKIDADIRTFEPVDKTSIIHIHIAENPDLRGKAGLQPKLDRAVFAYNENLDTWLETR